MYKQGLFGKKVGAQISTFIHLLMFTILFRYKHKVASRSNIKFFMVFKKQLNLYFFIAMGKKFILCYQSTTLV